MEEEAGEELRRALVCARAAAEMQAEDVEVLDLRGLSSIADFFVICSATSTPHLKAVRREVEEAMRLERGSRPRAADGGAESQWLVVDFGDVIAHIFHRDKRGFYGLESLWADAPRVSLGGFEVPAQGVEVEGD